MQAHVEGETVGDEGIGPAAHDDLEEQPQPRPQVSPASPFGTATSRAPHHPQTAILKYVHVPFLLCLLCWCTIHTLMARGVDVKRRVGSSEVARGRLRRRAGGATGGGGTGCSIGVGC